jgi:hypothetical protein
MRRSTLLSASLVSAVALLTAATPAHAQLGRLKKLGTDAIKEAAKDKVVGKDTTGTTKSGAPAAETSASRAPAKKANYVISADRVDLVLASLQPLVADAEAIAAANKASADYEAKKKTADACIERASKMVNPMAMMAENPQRDTKMATIQKQLDGVNKRSQAAMARDDFRNSIALRDTALVLTMSMSVATIGANCTYPYMPAALIDAQVRLEKRGSSGSSSDDDSDASLDPTPGAKQAMTRQEFGMVRERIALWVMGQDNPAILKGSAGKFTADEEEAMKAKGPQLKKLSPLFSSNALRWSTWGDVKNW